MNGLPNLDWQSVSSYLIDPCMGFLGIVFTLISGAVLFSLLKRG